MKLPDKAAIAMGIVGLLMMVCVFGKPLEIPPAAQFALMAAVAISLGFVFYFIKQAKKADTPPPPMNEQQKKSVLIMVTLSVACVVGPFLMPLQGIHLPLHVRVLISLGTFVICMVIVAIGMKVKR
jgi:divalent metal cation (Fe/Co/Zn/Cd) transporter